VSDRGWVDAVGGEALVPAPDAIARDYILLGLRLDQLMPGIVDSYIGPRDLKAQVDMAPVPTATQLAADARELRERVARQVAEPDRARWLDRQLLALETLAALQVGATMPYVEDVRRCFDAAPEALPAGAYAAARAALDAALPGSGEIRRRMEAWDERLVVPAERLAAVVAWLVPRLREASGVVFAAPAGESVKVSLVADQPWSGYNWYDGGLVSRVDLNTDLPIRAPDLVATLSHETFPGHHLEHTWKEARLIREQGRLEASLLLLNTPECFVSEGLAELGRRYVLPRDAHLRGRGHRREHGGRRARAGRRRGPAEHPRCRRRRGLDAASRRAAGGDRAGLPGGRGVGHARARCQTHRVRQPSPLAHLRLLLRGRRAFAAGLVLARWRIRRPGPLLPAVDRAAHALRHGRRSGPNAPGLGDQREPSQPNTARAASSNGPLGRNCGAAKSRNGVAAIRSAKLKAESCRMARLRR
jgi:hypothetical protein